MSTVLIVEDEEQVAEILKIALAPIYAVKRGATAAAGLQELAGGGIDAVVLDVNLPDSQGAATVAMFISRFPDVPILSISADRAVESACLQAGAQSFLPKPELSLTMTDIVRHIIERHQVRQAYKPALAALEHGQRLAEDLTKAMEPKLSPDLPIPPKGQS